MSNWGCIAVLGMSDARLAQQLYVAAELDVVPVETLASFPACLITLALALVVFGDTPSSINSRALQAFKRNFPALPVILAVRSASLETARLALCARVWAYVETGVSLNPLYEALKTLRQARLAESRDWTRQPIFPSGEVESEDLRFAARLVGRVVAYVNSHLDESLSSGTLAERFSIDERTLLRYFKRERGETLRHFIRQRRVEEAACLLARSALSVKEIAHRLGFSDAAHFVRTFRDVKHLTPGEFRRRVA